MRVFNETGYERWIVEEVTGTITSHEAKEFHTLVEVREEQHGRQEDPPRRRVIRIPHGR